MPIEEKPSRNEDEYFVKLDAELLKQRRAQLDAERAARERKAHLMKCPKCGGELKEREYNHVKIDACSECGGVWLDAGELELVAHQYPGGMAGRLIGMLRGSRR
jgi:hypothetical protein